MPESRYDPRDPGNDSGSVPERPWFSLSVPDALEHLSGSLDGLSESEAAERLRRDGPNVLPVPPRDGPVKRFLLQFHNILIYVLLGAAIISFAIGEVIDASVILGVVFINAIVGFVQEGKAERALDAIRDMLAPNATVRRDGARMQTLAASLVAGDIVLLNAGDKVPADLRLLDVQSLEIMEAALTGESLSIEKSTEPVSSDCALGDRVSMAYAGTIVTQGSGIGIVTDTAERTELGRITGLIATVEPLQTPLMRQLARFASVLTGLILLMAVGMALFGWVVQDYSGRDMFMAAVGLAVAAIPEGLPAIMTIALAIGVTRMAARRAIVRRLPAVETLGAVSVICSDKTGTLTQNRLEASDIVTAEATETPVPGLHTAGKELLRGGLLCNDGEADWHADGWRYHGNPTDTAFLKAAVASGFDPAPELDNRPRVAALPFDSRRKFMATRHVNQDAGGSVLYLKGAPERVLDRCDREWRSDGEHRIDRSVWETRLHDLANQGRRVLAVAMKVEAAEDASSNLDENEVEGGFTLLGYIGLIDPPRPEVREAVARCRAAGIKVKMVTGDHAATALSIATDIGIGDGRTVVTGPELDRMDRDQLVHRIGEADVFARTTPEHKIHLVEALQKAGAVIAMTGDGVNDAPALKRADVGTAMGINGTEAAKEASEMVLADDNFSSIANAVEEGRTVFDNLRKSILFILPTSVGWSLVILTAVLAGGVLPVNPAQILWVNMIITVTLALAIAFEPAESDVMARPPRDPNAPLLDRFLVWRTLFVGALMVVGAYGLFLWAETSGRPLESARTLAVTALVTADCAYLINARRLSGRLFSRQRVMGNPYIWPAIGVALLLQLVFTIWGPLQTLFGSAPLLAIEWAAAFGFALALMFAVEGERSLLRRFAYSADRARLSDK